MNRRCESAAGFALAFSFTDVFTSPRLRGEVGEQSEPGEGQLR